MSGMTKHPAAPPLPLPELTPANKKKAEEAYQAYLDFVKAAVAQPKRRPIDIMLCDQILSGVTSLDQLRSIGSNIGVVLAHSYGDVADASYVDATLARSPDWSPDLAGAKEAIQAVLSGFFYEMRRISVRLVPTSACVVIVRKGKIAVIRSHKHNGAINLPGGKSDPGEDPWDTAVRECLEEVGVVATLVRELHITPDDGNGYRCHVYLATISDESELVSGAEGIADWVTPEEVLTGTYKHISAIWMPLIQEELKA